MNIKIKDTWTEPITGMEFIWVPKGFWIGKYPVTQGQWEKVTGNNHAYFQKGDNYPVENVSWIDCLEFIKKLSDNSEYSFSLPTSKQWEVAAGDYKYSGSNNIDEVAWYKDNSEESTHPVGLKKPNGFGIYDMSGNVWEWCQGQEGKRWALRGGSWLDYAKFCRSDYRCNYSPGSGIAYIGLRLVRA